MALHFTLPAFVRRNPLSVIGISVLFCASLALGSIALFKHQSVDKRLFEDAVWATYQLDREVRDVRIALLEASPEALESLKMAYDILYSRLRVVERGQVAQLIHRVQVREYDVDQVLADIRALDEPLMSLDAASLPEQRPSLNSKLKEIQHATGQIATEVNHFFSRQRQADRESLDTLIRATLFLVTLTMLAGVLLLLQLRRQRKALEHRQEKLRDTNEKLDAARREAESASQAKSDFMAVMSHEIRTPLNGIVGITDLLENEVISSVTGREYLSALRDSTHALSTVINDILDYSRIAAGKLSLAPQPFDLGLLLDSLCRNYSLRAKGTAIAFACHRPPLGVVFADPNRLRQVLMNLLNNAFKFTDSGSITLEVTQNHADETSISLLFSVEDTGCGMSQSQQKKLFQPFSQVDTSLSRQREGTGLGLVICQQLIEAMGGTIQLESTLDCGSRFYFSLSLLRSQLPEGEQDLPEVSVVSARVLVVEDNAINQMLIRKQLSKLGHQVDIVENGQQALDKVDQSSFDVILMDMQMPVMDGLAATKALRRRGDSTPILALTANAMPEDRQRCLDAGMQEVITKPVHASTLERQLNHYVVLGANG
ncbi:response regulator [Vreelandella massiliensis]|uniref:response regulator n=1 Tax=Vreelandella massiliensis TaxID=1816686 RepID=UPI00096A98AE|nr:response regulator [Halomonas massiliensis]MYL25093.1 response regulator [Halomonas alkaliantarctica]